MKLADAYAGSGVAELDETAAGLGRAEGLSGRFRAGVVYRAAGENQCVSLSSQV